MIIYNILLINCKSIYHPIINDITLINVNNMLTYILLIPIYVVSKHI